MYGDGLDLDTNSGITAGDVFGASLWGTSLYFCSPLQLLLLFIGVLWFQYTNLIRCAKLRRCALLCKGVCR